MRIVILPSWCPSRNAPHAGSFFLEQAHALAMACPDWQISIVLHDLARARAPLSRPWRLPRFFLDVLRRKKLRITRAASGLMCYEVFLPYLPYRRKMDAYEVSARSLAAHCDIALASIELMSGPADMVHAEACYPAGAALAYLRRAANAVFCLSEHLGPFPPASLCDRAGTPHKIIHNAYRSAHLHSAVSTAIAAKIRALGLSEHVAIMPNFLPDSLGAPSLHAYSKNSDVMRGHEKTDEASSPFHLLAVGGPSMEKGTDILLEAVARSDRDIVLTLIGECARARGFQKRAKDLNIAHKVRFVGTIARDAIGDYYRACHAVIVASRFESFSVVCIEALAHGKPVIATRCGGPEDIVHAHNGLLIAPASSVELVAAISVLMDTYSRYSADTIRQDFLARFSASAIIPLRKAWYQDGVAQKSLALPQSFSMNHSTP